MKYTLHLLLRVVNNVKIANTSAATSQGHLSRHPPSNNVKIGFLGLRVLLTCYGDNLTKEWLTIAATIRKYGNDCDQSVALWKLLDYIDVYRTPLYNMMLNFIRNRVIMFVQITLHYGKSRRDK